MACAPKVSRHLTASVPRAVQKRRVDHRHQRQRLVRFRHRRAAVARTTDPQQTTLRRDRQAVVSSSTIARLRSKLIDRRLSLKIALHHQLSDLGVQLFHLALAGNLGDIA